MEDLDYLDLYETSSSESESSGSSDSEFIEMMNWAYKRQEIKERKIHERYMFEDLDDEAFEKRFRMPRYMVNEMADKIKYLEYLNNRNQPLSARDQLLIALRYYDTGSFQIVLSDLFGISQSTASRVIERVSRAIAKMADNEVNFPRSHEELRESKHKFYELQGIPYVIGIIDGTHIPIQSPGGSQSELFRNRKGYFSINTQICCDFSMKIIDINARWHGSVHDQCMFNFSKLKIRLENAEFGNSVILGDAGYACTNYLITPLSNPVTEKEKNFQSAFIKTRVLVERTIGIWKKRFPVLSTKMRVNLKTAVIVIVATSVLHNILRSRDVPPREIEPDPALIDPETIPTNTPAETARRNLIIQHFF